MHKNFLIHNTIIIHKILVTRNNEEDTLMLYYKNLVI